MARIIVKLEKRYFEWSTVVDAPVTEPMTRWEFLAYYRDMYGRAAQKELPDRMKRVQQKGTSALSNTSVLDLISFNRAGPGETCLSIDELRAWARGERKNP